MHYFGLNGSIDLDKRVSKDTDSETKKSITLVVAAPRLFILVAAQV